MNRNTYAFENARAVQRDLGVHYPGDMSGGVLLGTLWSLSACWLTLGGRSGSDQVRAEV